MYVRKYKKPSDKDKAARLLSEQLMSDQRLRGDIVSRHTTHDALVHLTFTAVNIKPYLFMQSQS